MDSIKLGIVGLGRFALLHLACLRQIPSVRIVAVCDVRSDLVKQTASELQCRGYTDCHEMLRVEQLDALDVLTPESSHHEFVVAGLMAGCDVFVEKPLEIDLQKAVQMVELARARGKLLMVGHVMRFDPRYVQMKQAIDEGKIGRIRSMYARRSDRREFFSQYKRTPVVFILGIHDIDQMLWCKNELPTEVYAKTSSSPEGEDSLCAMMTFRDGSTAMLDCNWLIPGSWPAAQEQYTQISGDLGIVRIQSPDEAFSLCSEQRYEFPYMFAVRDVHGQLEGPLVSELRHFIDCVSKARPSEIAPPDAALRAVRVAAAIQQSSERQQPVFLDSEQSFGRM